MRLLTFLLLLICLNSYGDQRSYAQDKALDLSYSRTWNFDHGKTFADECEAKKITVSVVSTSINIICYAYTSDGFYAGDAKIKVLLNTSDFSLISIEQIR